jgi:DNA polymerase
MMVDDKLSLNKATRSALLQLDLPDEVLDVVQCIDDISASSVAKFKRMGELADVEDHRVRGAFVFNGGSATGRASSYGVQLQNMARVCAKDPVAVRSAMMSGGDLGAFGNRVTDVLKGMIRPAIIPAPGNVLIVADWAGIEARCNPWLSNHVASEAKLDIFRSGGDVYVENAKSTFNTKEVTKEQRFVGKVQELALGYSGGAGAFASMARIYGLNMPEHQIKRMINGWRVANPWCIPYGQELERAYMSAMRHKGHEFSAGRVTYLFDGNHLWYILPSGRILNYPFARIEDGAVTYLKAAFKPASDAVEWPRARLWQGIAQENCAQATANDLLRYSLRQLDGVIAHIHDEIVVECREDEAENITKRMTSSMCSAPVWAEGVPLAVEINTMVRYGK